MSKGMMIGIGIAVAVVVILMMKKKGGVASAVKSPASVASGGTPSYAQQAERAAWGIAQTQLGNIFGGGSSGPSPAGSTQASNDQLIQGEIGSWFNS